MMKKIWVAALLLTAATMTANAQESRQDVSLSAVDFFAPHVNGNSVNLYTSMSLGALASYRYMLTPRSALEANYGFTQNSQSFRSSFVTDGRVHAQQHEVSVAYVYSLNFKNFNPFVEIGGGAILYHPIKDYGTVELDVKQEIRPGGLFGGGLAYEISPSFDVRIEYRGFLSKSPDFKLNSGSNSFSTNRYDVTSSPAVGIAYHF